MDDDDEYEKERLENIKRNQELLKDLDLVGHSTAPRRSTGSNGKTTPRSKSKTKPTPKKREQPERIQPRRASNRLAGIEADSETYKRKAEEEAESARKQYEAEKRARHEAHDLGFLLGVDEKSEIDERKQMEELELELRGISSIRPTLGAEMIEDLKELKRRKSNGIKDEKHKELKEVMDRMELLSVDKVVMRRIYSMIVHPNPEKDLIFVADKEGSIGVWDPLAKNENDEEGEMNSGRSWSLQVHGKSPITCLRFDPISADSLFSSSYDSTIRMQSLQSGLSTEIWSGQDDVLISIFDILAPKSHPSAFLRTPDAGLDERSLWIADHRGGLCHFDLRQQNARRKVETSRWQVCEKKIGGMSINPTISSCISVASLDQHVRLFDVRNLQTLPTTNEAPYSARNVDEEILRVVEENAQIGYHKAKLACTSVDWDPTGTKLVGVSYDDMVKIWDIKPSWLHTTSGPPTLSATPAKKGKVKQEHADAFTSAPDRPDDLLAKMHSIRHNNQTGKWLTLFRARFNANPTVESHFSIGSMDRRAEIWAADGTLLRSFYDEDHVTAVPAVTATHPRRVGRLATGNASGKCTFWAERE
ncbi:hypothetical protein L7F22_037259 [Adiantum nelumboides]|nr:hypothetical protein [Adiantum nelumboides]